MKDSYYFLQRKKY